MMESNKRMLEIKAGQSVPYELIAKHVIWQLRLLTKRCLDDDVPNFKCDDNDIEIHIIKKRSSED